MGCHATQILYIILNQIQVKRLIQWNELKEMEISRKNKYIYICNICCIQEHSLQ